ncbi:MAG: ATP-dependent RNA helicase DbpA [Gammaproteobacteria bacterium]|nr:ATP-dependent RNA helicase DbpA [Gammaproteobacteria bacterium]
MTANLFSELALKPQLLTRLNAMGFDTMTPVQAASLPSLMAGKDVIAQASTGSGKTAAFALACLQRLNSAAFHVQSLVLCPTRELAEQVAQSARDLAKNLANTKILTLCGGVPLGPQIGSLQHSAHIIVGTPGRVLKHLQKGTLHLHGLEVTVFDEADRMLDMGFADEIDAICSYLPQPRQTLLFSATFPEGVQNLAQGLNDDAVHIDVTTHEAAPPIRQQWCGIDARDRDQALVSVLAHFGGERNMVFCNTKIECAEVSARLCREGMKAVTLHGDLEQQQRTQTLVRFANGSANVLVASDVAARGLDIDSVDAVFNHTLPAQPEVYVHRIGRTGRGGEAGRAISLVADREMNRLHGIEAFMQQGPMSVLQLPDRAPNGPLPDPLFTTLEINGGRRHKLRPGDILGALTAHASITGAVVGKIDLLDQSTFVAVHSSVVTQALQQLNQHKVKGRTLRARRAG